jgi:hypothetical protein
MTRIVVLSALAIAGCGDVITDGAECAAGTHLDNGSCIADTACMPTSCGGHGECSAGDGAIACACEGGYAGTNCSACAAGFQDNDGSGTCTPDCASAGACGAHGTCSDQSGAPTCNCTHGTTGADCGACVTPTARIVMDVFGRVGQHHTIDVQPGDIVVAELPTDTVAGGGYVGGGEVSFAQVPGVPGNGARFTLAFSRCPGDMTSFSGGQSPCFGETTNPVGLNMRWSNGTAMHWSRCHLPPADGPWYANLEVDYDPQVEDCLRVFGRCVINWQWN